MSKAVKGDKNFTSSHEGFTYYFSSGGNKEEFRRKKTDINWQKTFH